VDDGVGCGRGHQLQQRASSFRSVGLAADVQGGGGCEPLGRLFASSQLLQYVGVDVPESFRARTRARPVQAAPRENSERRFGLAQVAPGTGRHDEQLSPSRGIKTAEAWVAQCSQRHLRSTKRPLTVSDYREVARVTRNPSRRLEFGERLGPFRAVIGRDAYCLADRTYPCSSSSSGARMFQCTARVRVDELAGGDEMTSDDLRVELGQAAQFRAYRLV
jgi:hypothetical protein